MTNKANIELIDRYLLEELTDEEIKLLEIQRMVDFEFDKELQVTRDISKGIEYVGNQELLQVLDKIHYKHIGAIKEKKISRKILVFGVLFLALSSMLLWIYKSFIAQDDNPHKIFAAYYDPYVPSLDTRGNSNPEVIEAFNKLYYSNEYKAAIELLEPTIDLANDELKLLAAICYIELDQNSKAIGVLNYIISNNSYYFIDHAHWFSALAKLKLEKKDEVNIHLEYLIKKANADHHNEALKLYKEIN